MKNPILWCIVAFLIQSGDIHSQQLQKRTALDQSLSFEMAAGEIHRFSLSMNQNQFVSFKIVGERLDLGVTAYDPNGKELHQFDHFSDGLGSEFFYLISKDIGLYSFEVWTDDKKVGSNGGYTLEILLHEPMASTVENQLDQLFHPWNTGSRPGFAVAVVKNGDIVYNKGYGMANLEYDIPITSNTVFHVASLSKQFTVFSILLLHSRGRLSMDDDIRTYFPELEDFGETITLKHLAEHTSGLRDQWSLLAMAGWRMDDVITMEHILKLAKSQRGLNFDPGSRFLYSNTGYSLLAEVVSRLTNSSFSEFTKKNIFEPLQMNHTQFYDNHEKIVPNRAYSYHHSKGNLKKSNLNFANVGATSLFTTAEDLSLWALNFEHMVIGDKELIETMNTPALLNDGSGFGGALGQFIGSYKGLYEINHAGADAGYRSYLGRFPDEGLSVVVLANYAEFKPEWAAHRVVDVYLKEKIDKTKLSLGQVSKKESIKRTARLVGKFKLSSNSMGNTSEQEGYFFYWEKILEEKESDTTKRITSNFIEKELLDTNYEHNISLKDYVGSFYSDELSTTYNISLMDGRLTVSHQRIEDFELQPSEKDTFSAEPWFARKIEFDRDDQEQVIGFRISSSRAWDVKFRKQ